MKVEKLFHEVVRNKGMQFEGVKLWKETGLNELKFRKSKKVTRDCGKKLLVEIR